MYLADYGLAYRYNPEGRHKEYKENPKKGHNGTIEYTSIDAHKGVGKGRFCILEILRTSVSVIFLFVWAFSYMTCYFHCKCCNLCSVIYLFVYLRGRSPVHFFLSVAVCGSLLPTLMRHTSRVLNFISLP